MTTELGPVTIEVPRDRAGSFTPVVVRKRQCRLGGIDEVVLLLAKGLITGEIAQHFYDIYGAHVPGESAPWRRWQCSRDSDESITDPLRSPAEQQDGRIKSAATSDSTFLQSYEPTSDRRRTSSGSLAHGDTDSVRSAVHRAHGLDLVCQSQCSFSSAETTRIVSSDRS